MKTPETRLTAADWPVGAIVLVPMLALWQIGAAAVAAAIILSLEIFIVSKAQELPRRGCFQATDAAVVAYAVSHAIAYFTSLYPPNSFPALMQTWTATALYFAARRLLQNRRQMMLALSIWIIANALLALLSLVQYSLHTILLELAGFDHPVHFKHLFQPFGFYANEWGTLYLLVLPMPLILFFHLRHKTARLVLLVLLPIFVLVIYTSYSRGLYLALWAQMFLIAVTIGVCAVRSAPQRILIGTGILALLGLSALPFGESALITLSGFRTASQRRSFSGRTAIWKQAVPMIRDRPVFGSGAYTFALRYPLYRDASEDRGFVSRAFNSYIQTAVERGVVGLAAFLALPAALGIAVLRRPFRLLPLQQRLVAGLWLCAIAALLLRELSYSNLVHFDALVVQWFAVLAFTTNEVDLASNI